MLMLLVSSRKFVIVCCVVVVADGMDVVIVGVVLVAVTGLLYLSLLKIMIGPSVL